VEVRVEVQVEVQEGRNVLGGGRFDGSPPVTPSRSVRWRCTRQCERDERALSRWPTAVRVCSIVRARRATSAGSEIRRRFSPTVANDSSAAATLPLAPGTERAATHID
jgi:hypothetical protein